LWKQRNGGDEVSFRVVLAFFAVFATLLAVLLISLIQLSPQVAR
jgi:hypothetical protein